MSCLLEWLWEELLCLVKDEDGMVERRRVMGMIGVIRCKDVGYN